MNPIINELKVLKDEIKVQSHLLSLELKEEFQTLEPKIENILKSIGDKNEEFWAGNKEEITKLVETLKEIKKNTK